MATTTRRKHRQIAEEAERQKLMHKEIEEIEEVETSEESKIDSDYEVETDILSEGNYETEEISYYIISDNENDDKTDININEESSKKKKTSN